MKRAKKVKITYKEVVDTIATYTCPHCKTLFVGGALKNVTRFKCSYCNNELIIENVK